MVHADESSWVPTARGLQRHCTAIVAAAQAGPRSDPADCACATPDDRIALACLKFVQRERAEKKETVLTAPDTPLDTHADLTPADPPDDAAGAATCDTVALQLAGVAPAAPPCSPTASAASSERTEDLEPQAAARMAAPAALYNCAYTSPTTTLPSAAGTLPGAPQPDCPLGSVAAVRQHAAHVNFGSRVPQDVALAAVPAPEPFDAAIAALGAMHAVDAHADAEWLPGASRRSKRSRAPVDYSGACTGSVAAAPRQAAAGAAAAQKARKASKRGPAGGQRSAQQVGADVERARHASRVDYRVDLQLSATARDAALAAAQALAAQLDKDTHTFPLVKVAF